MYNFDMNFEKNADEKERLRKWLKSTETIFDKACGSFEEFTIAYAQLCIIECIADSLRHNRDVFYFESIEDSCKYDASFEMLYTDFLESLISKIGYNTIDSFIFNCIPDKDVDRFARANWYKPYVFGANLSESMPGVFYAKRAENAADCIVSCWDNFTGKYAKNFSNFSKDFDSWDNERKKKYVLKNFIFEKRNER